MFLDTNVVLARCLDPAMEAKGKLAEEAFDTLRQEGIVPRISESVRREFDAKVYSRVGQIADAIRRLMKGAVPKGAEGKTGIEILEETFSRLRSESPDAAGALQLLEARLAKDLTGDKVFDADLWQVLLATIMAETIGLLAEIERRYDTAKIEVVRPPGALDHELFRPFVKAADLDHIASAARLAQVRRVLVIFVTLDSELHAVRSQISDAEPSLVVTTPPYLPSQVRSTRMGRSEQD